MTSNAKTQQRQNEKDRAAKREVSKACQEYWNGFVTSPLFDELQLILQESIPTVSTSESVHHYAHSNGKRDGWMECIETLRLGVPKDRSVASDASEAIYNTFGAPPRKTD
jgi:hypothetical protein